MGAETLNIPPAHIAFLIQWSLPANKSLHATAGSAFGFSVTFGAFIVLFSAVREFHVRHLYCCRFQGCETSIRTGVCGIRVVLASCSL